VPKAELAVSSRRNARSVLSLPPVSFEPRRPNSPDGSSVRTRSSRRDCWSRRCRARRSPATATTPADVLGRTARLDVQAVVVAVGHVAERHAVEREAELVLVEAADEIRVDHS
jgi:hypothetical protein